MSRLPSWMCLIFFDLQESLANISKHRSDLNRGLLREFGSLTCQSPRGLFLVRNLHDGIDHRALIHMCFEDQQVTKQALVRRYVLLADLPLQGRAIGQRPRGAEVLGQNTGHLIYL